ncbi:MAG TPA: DUF222 domain-containing protein [Acidimicrobiales bacterium]|jgi:hypothetical protein
MGLQALEALRTSLDELMAVNAMELSDRETVVELERLTSQMEAVVCRSVGAFERRGAWGAEGAKTIGHWIAGICLIPRSTANRQAALSHAIEGLPAFTEAWGKGEVTAAHVETVGRLHRPDTEEALKRDEEELLQQAKELPFHHFRRYVSYWEQEVDQFGTEWDASAQRAARDVSLYRCDDRMWKGKLTLDPISGAIVENELRRLEYELFKSDWAEAKERLGQDPKHLQLARTGTQRRADALVEMATRSGTAPKDGRRPAPLFTVLVDYPTLRGRICELSQGMPITPGSLLRWIDQAYVERVVFGLGKRIEVSEQARFFSGATRRALEVRDRECSHPLCDESADRCEADHIQPFSEGGLTIEENGRMLCPFHNRLRNQGEKGRSAGWGVDEQREYGYSETADGIRRSISNSEIDSFELEGLLPIPEPPPELEPWQLVEVPKPASEPASESESQSADETELEDAWEPDPPPDG